MTPDEADRVVVAMSTYEAQLVIAALRQYEPYWNPGDPDSRDVLSQVRVAIDHVKRRLEPQVRGA